MTWHIKAEEDLFVASKNRSVQELDHFTRAFCGAQNRLFFGWYFEIRSIFQFWQRSFFQN